MAGIVTGQARHGRTSGKMSGYPQPDIKPDTRGPLPLGRAPLSGLSDRAPLSPRKRKGCDMTDTITTNHPELARMYDKSGALSMSDIPGFVCLCRHLR